MYLSILTGNVPRLALNDKMAPNKSRLPAINAVSITELQKASLYIFDKGYKFIPIFLIMRCIILFLLSITGLCGQDVRIEPPSWWIGMKDTKLQLMIHSAHLSNAKISIQKPGVKLVKIHKSESPNYLFLDLLVLPGTIPGDLIINIGNKSIKYPLYGRELGSATRKGFDHSDIIYLITPDRFANGDPSNDNLPEMIEQANRKNRGGRHGGDIQGISAHLDYIKEMGFTTLWSMPLLENNLATYTYHGYAISDFYKTDPRFGTNEQFKALCLQAKSKGIKTIMDIVLNHCGSGHWWMKDIPFKDWINYGGNYINTNHRREANQDIHASTYDKEKMQAGWFVETMPDMNTRNPYLATYLIQNTIWWIEYAHLAGLRIDTYPYVDKTFSSRWSKAVLHEYPHLNMVGEEWSYNPNIVSYWQKGGKNKDGYTSSLKSLFDFPMQSALVNGLNEKEAFNDGLIKIYQTLANDFVYPDANNLVIMTDNHDMSRFYTQVGENFNRWKQGMVLLMTMRGIPQVYYGTEVLITNPLSDDHGEIRADMPGGWPGDTKNVFTQIGLNDKEKEALEFTKQLCNLRITTPALQKGKLIHFAAENGVYVYFRLLNEEKYMIVINKNNKEVTLDQVKYNEVINSASYFINVLDGKTEKMEEAMKINGDGYKVLKF